MMILQKGVPPSVGKTTVSNAAGRLAEQVEPARTGENVWVFLSDTVIFQARLVCRR